MSSREGELGDVSIRVALNSEVAECGSDPESLRDGIYKALQDYLARCPNVVRVREFGDAPS
jgi:hypothetical protein